MSDSVTLYLSFGNAPTFVAGLADCGEKSVCVQRFSFYTLLAIHPFNQSNSQPPSQPRDREEKEGTEEEAAAADSKQLSAGCPTLRAFRFPSGCVCNRQK